MNRASFITTLKEGVRFTLRSKDYRGLIAALNEGNNTLRTLVLQSKELEPSRQARIRIGLILYLRQLTTGMYTSLCASVNCKCAPAHGFGLQLPPQKGGLIHMIENPRITKLTFEIAFGTNRAKSTERWAYFHAALEGLQFFHTVSTNTSYLSWKARPSQSSPSSAESSGRFSIPPRVVNSTSPSSPVTSTTSTITFLKTNAAHHPGSQAGALKNPLPIDDLCRECVEEKKSLKGECFGFVTDKTNEFYLSHGDRDSTCFSLVTLREMLSGNHPQLPQLDYSQKVRIAHTLSSNVLPLVTTPWLEKMLTLDEIAIFRAENSPNGWVYHLDQVYLAKSLKTAPTTPNSSCGHPTHLPSDKYKPLTILSLACLLVQILLGHSMKDFDIAERSCLGCLMTQQAAASRKLGAVLAKGGNMYADAVSWCLENYLSAVNLDDGEFNHRYYSTVVAKLEALVDIVESFSGS